MTLLCCYIRYQIYQTFLASFLDSDVMRFDCTCNYLLITLLWVAAEGEGGVSMMRCRTASYWTVMHRLATSTVVTCCRCWSWERDEWFVDGADVGGSRGALSQHLLSNVWFVGFTASGYQWCSNLLLSLSKARVRWVSLRWSWCWRRLRCVVTATCSRPFAPSTVSASSTTRTLSVMSAARYGNCYCCRCHLSVITTTLSSCSVCLLHTQLHSLLWHCWLGISKSMPVKIEQWGVGMAIFLERDADCLWSSRCHCIPKPHHLLPHLNPEWFYLSGTDLHRLSWKRPLSGCSGSGSSSSSSHRCIMIHQVGPDLHKCCLLYTSPSPRD